MVGYPCDAARTVTMAWAAPSPPRGWRCPRLLAWWAATRLSRRCAPSGGAGRRPPSPALVVGGDLESSTTLLGVGGYLAWWEAISPAGRRSRVAAGRRASSIGGDGVKHWSAVVNRTGCFHEFVGSGGDWERGWGSSAGGGVDYGERLVIAWG
jgi:hypothetical protein